MSEKVSDTPETDAEEEYLSFKLGANGKSIKLVRKEKALDLERQLAESERNREIVCNSYADENQRLSDEIATLRKAVGLMTTLKPDLEMDVNHPLAMMQEVHAHISTINCAHDMEIAALRQQLEGAQKRIVYQACDRHVGQPWTIVTYLESHPYEHVCPLCERNAALEKDND